MRLRELEAQARAREEGAAGTVKYVPHRPTLRQSLFLELPDKEAFYGGAAGGGKSDALLAAALEHVGVAGYSALILRRTYADLAKPGALLDRANEWLRGTDAKPTENGKKWRFPSGAILTFGYLENENDKYQYQSAEYQFIGFDELTQFTETQYTYLFSRLRRLADVDIPLRMRSASNPGGIGANWVKARFVPDDFLPAFSEEARVWHKEAVGHEGEPLRRAFVPARLQDNPFLDASTYKQSLDELDHVTREQLLKGDWTITAVGRQRFDARAVGNYVPRRGDVGELLVYVDERMREAPRFRPTGNGLLERWREPQRGALYVIGADTAQGRDVNNGEGNPDPDYSVAQVRNQETGEQVARLRGRITERAFGEYLYLLGVYYNMAFIVPEVTGGYGSAMLTVLLDRGYPMSRIYNRRNEDKPTPITQEELGWQTTTTTRPRLLSWLDTAIVERSIETYDPVTINEYLSFEIDKNGKAQARVGCHDDCVIADGLTVVGIMRAPRRESLRYAGLPDHSQNPFILARQQKQGVLRRY